MIQLTEINYYPIKSCRGTSLAEAQLGPRGILHDREFMVVQAANGSFLTQRELPRLALIRPELTGGRLRLTAPASEPFELAVATEGPRQRVVVWNDTCEAVDQGEAVADWLSSFLGAAVRLVRIAEGFVRKVTPDYAISPRDEVGFADGFPLLLATQESLDDLNQRLATPLPMNRFRPNLVISGSGEPFAEDRYQTIRIGEVIFHLVKPCSRCVTTTVDQATGQTGHEPLTTLASYRRQGSKVLFGQNLIHASEGRIRRGDAVEVLDFSL